MQVAFVTGCFDVLHMGHIKLFDYAKELADVLYVAVDSDARVAEAKGRARPINSLADRMAMLEHLECVDDVVAFATDSDLGGIIEIIRPDFLVVGSDWKGKPIIGGHHAGEIKYFDRIEDYSTTNIISRGFVR